MSVNFYPPSYRAAASDLTIAISPLGLVELADEEFEVHGPRLNRYASNWAWYLGYHWAYKREIGEPQLTFNWVKAFSDYLVNFCFGKGVNFHAPEATSGITPYTLKEVWEVHNNKMAVIMELAQLGSVSGDVFCKVAYEEPYVDPAGVPVAGKIRILPLNPAFCFPEWHPHDRTRLIRFKLKYKFWGTAQDGSRMVMTYVELMTEDVIEEYINDELIDARPNPIGEIPIAFTPNIAVASSPWGLADINDLVSLNREYNEKATEISDIINYHVSPVTVITGAKASNLEKGPRKVWAINNKDAKVSQLEMETNFTGPLGYMELIKQAMHELTGVPAQALGTMQPISNTSGVALTVQYQPLMVSYRSYVDWPTPMPMDKLIKINEIQAMMAMNLESRKGALRDLGYAFPDQKLQEIFEEVLEDTKQQGALDLVRGQIAAFTMMATGMSADGQPMMSQDAEGNPVPMLAGVDPNLAAELQDRAYGVTPPQMSDFDVETT